MNARLDRLVLIRQIIEQSHLQRGLLWILESEEAAIDTGIVFQNYNRHNFYALPSETPNNQ